MKRTERIGVGFVAMWVVLSAGVVLPTAGQESKYIGLETMGPRNNLDVFPDGTRVVLSSTNFLLLDETGKLAQTIGFPTWGTRGFSLHVLPDGWYLRGVTGSTGHVALCRPDGTEVKQLVNKGNMGTTAGNMGETYLRHDMTGWTSPTAMAVDTVNKIIFLCDVTVAPNDDRKLPTPDWSRIGMWDFDGKYLGDINRFDAYAPNAKDNDDKRTWMSTLAVDPESKRVYTILERHRKLVCYDYQGKELFSAADKQGRLCALPNGRIALGHGNKVTVFDRDLKELATHELPSHPLCTDMGIKELKADASGRLYMLFWDQAVKYARWSADFTTLDVLLLDHLRVLVGWPDRPLTTDGELELTVRVQGQPAPAPGGTWQVLVRPSDGSSLEWQVLPSAFDGEKPNTLKVKLPGHVEGYYEFAVRYGQGAIDWTNRGNDPYIQRRLLVLPKEDRPSVSILTTSLRSAFQPGERIGLQVVRRGGKDSAIYCWYELKGPGLELRSENLPFTRTASLEIPAEITRRLAPGDYTLTPHAEYHKGYPLTFHIATDLADSPMQRILYHEFGQAPNPDNNGLADGAEQAAYLRQYFAAVQRQGWTRETDRAFGAAVNGGGPRAGSPRPWGQGDQDVMPTGERFSPMNNSREQMMDLSTRFGLLRDSTVFGHCASYRFRDVHLQQVGPGIQRFMQAYERFPSFYGINYNDEIFFDNQYDVSWTKADTQWLDDAIKEKFPGRPRADAYRYAMETMYGSLNAAVRQAAPKARITTAPMWQFPAVDGSYAPTIYAGMDESYSHFISEGMHIPFYALHSAEFLRRPGKPLMGVFDNGYHGDGGDVYMKNAMLVLGRGVQGIGVAHTSPLGTPAVTDSDAPGADVYRVTNLLAAMYGPVFAEFPLADEAAVLYSYEQDITERRNSMGTPQWERVYAMTAAGAMAGLPTRIVYEEDVAADCLLDKDGKVMIPALFIIGVKVDLPEATRAGIAKFIAAGGKVYLDADSKDFPNATRLAIQTYPADLRDGFRNNYCVDSWFSEIMPPLERLTKELQAALGDKRRMQVDTSDPFVAKSYFDGGAIQYVMLSNETSPFPWDAPTNWSMGGVFNKKFLPKVVTLTLPPSEKSPVVYDVFEHKVVETKVGADGRVTLPVDLRNYPGRLYAIASAPVSPPLLGGAIKDGDSFVTYTVYMGDVHSPMAARVPLRIRLLDSQGRPVQCFYTATDETGRLTGQMTIPINDRTFTLEVCELLTGQATTSDFSCGEPGPAFARGFVRPRLPVEAMRTDRVEAMLQAAGGTVTLVAGDTDVLTAHQKRYLTRALAARKITLVEGTVDPETPTSGVYITAWRAGDPRTRSLFARLIEEGDLLSQPLTPNLPGAGNGLFSAVFSPRGWQEHCIAIVAGDELGMARAVDELAAFIEGAQPAVAANPPLDPAAAGGRVQHKPSAVFELPKQIPLPALSDMTGIKLGEVKVSADGKRLLVSAPGYQRNLAFLQDDGDKATMLTSVRLGQGPAPASLFITDDGQTFGAANTFAQPWIQGLQLFRTYIAEGGMVIPAPTPTGDIITSFGEYGRFRNTFAVSGDGHIVAPGPYGVICWRQTPGAGIWTEAWAIDYWKEFDKLTWEVSADFMRIPQFHAFIPPKADFVLVTFSELTNNGWVVPRFHGKAWLAAYDLKTGQQKWKFDVPIPDAQLFVELTMSPSGQRLLLRAQMGSWGQETYRYYSMNAAGEVLGSWDVKSPPMSVALSDNGRVVGLFKERLVEVRDEKGLVQISRLWDDCHPLCAAFLGDTVYLTDDAGMLSRLDHTGKVNARVELGGVAQVTAGHNVLYTAQWNGRLKSFTGDLQQRWAMDMSPHMTDADPVAALAASAKLDGVKVVQAVRASTTSTEVPAGENLLAGAVATKEDVKNKDGRVTGQRNVAANDKAVVRVGGTPGWLSGGRITIKPEQLTNGLKDDVTTPWIPIGDLDTNAWTGRQAWVEIEFKQPTDVKAVTVYENPNHPASFPREAQVMVWNEQTQDWDTVTHGVFMQGPVNTYTVNLKAVTKLRYVPWHSYWTNFYTSEIEVR